MSHFGRIESTVDKSFLPPSCEQAAEAQLVARVCAGDLEATTALVRKHAGPILAVARRSLRTAEDSADVVQDAFLSAFRCLHRFGRLASAGYPSRTGTTHPPAASSCSR